METLIDEPQSTYAITSCRLFLYKLSIFWAGNPMAMTLDVIRVRSKSKPSATKRRFFLLTARCIGFGICRFT